MQDIIEKLAQVDVPSDLLAHINVDEVLRRFRHNFKKLDDLKTFRTEYEKQNAIARWWNNDELEDAQLDAQQLQAEFSKTVGQLIVISMLQSQRLANQQQQLAQQQTEIKQQADKIEAHANALEGQHAQLHQQSVGLESLVTQYFELRGLTQEGAKKLIAIADEVKKTKDALLDAFEGKLLQAQAISDRLEQQTSEAVNQFDTRLEHGISELDAKNRELGESVDARCAAIEAWVRDRATTLDQQIKDSARESMGRQARLEEQIGELEGTLEKSRAIQQQQTEEVRQLLASVREDVDAQRTLHQIERTCSAAKIRRLWIALGAVALSTIALFGYNNQYLSL